MVNVVAFFDVFQILLAFRKGQLRDLTNERAVLSQLIEHFRWVVRGFLGLAGFRYMTQETVLHASCTKSRHIYLVYAEHRFSPRKTFSHAATVYLRVGHFSLVSHGYTCATGELKHHYQPSCALIFYVSAVYIHLCVSVIAPCLF